MKSRDERFGDRTPVWWSGHRVVDRTERPGRSDLGVGDKGYTLTRGPRGRPRQTSGVRRLETELSGSVRVGTKVGTEDESPVVGPWLDWFTYWDLTSGVVFN